MCEEDEDGEGVDEPDHDGSGNEPHELSNANDAEDDLENPGEDDGRNEVVEPVVSRDWRDDKGDSTCRGGDHGGAAAKERDGYCHGEGGEQAKAWVYPGDDGERDCFRDEREGDNEPGKNFSFQAFRGLERGKY